MTDLDIYLARYFQDSAQFAATCGISQAQLHTLIQNCLVPRPSYVVTRGMLSSHAFGTLPAAGSQEGEYFHPGTRAWVERALHAIQEAGKVEAHGLLRQRFDVAMRAALQILDRDTWRLRDAFTAQGSAIEAGLRARLDSMWQELLLGTYGVCVAEPRSADTIAHKEVLQEKLVALTNNGSRSDYAPAEIPTLLATLEAYAAAAMPFSPVEYPLSSRKRLVDDQRRYTALAARGIGKRRNGTC